MKECEMTSKRPSKTEVRSIVIDHISYQYTRKPTVADTTTQLERLHENLVEAARSYEIGPKQQREAVGSAVRSVSEFLNSQGFSTQTLAPLHRVSQALVEICQQNRPDPLFSEKPKKGKSQRGLADAIRQGRLAAFADAWLECHSTDEGTIPVRLARAARRMTGPYFGDVSKTMLDTARSYQRQTGNNPLIYNSYKQMKDALEAEARVAGGGMEGHRIAIEVQIDALNAKTEINQA
jgi:hypothetical protein